MAPQLFNAMPNIELTLLFGQYAQQYYLGDRIKENLTETVRNYESYLPQYLPLPHPSPRNGIWMKRNPWFEEETLLTLSRIIKNFLKNQKKRS